MFIGKILTETFNYGVENRAKIFHSLKYPGIGIIIISLFGRDASDAFTIQSFIVSLTNFYFFILFTINCHRLFFDKNVPIGLIETLNPIKMQWSIQSCQIWKSCIGCHTLMRHQPLRGSKKLLWAIFQRLSNPGMKLVLVSGRFVIRILNWDHQAILSDTVGSFRDRLRARDRKLPMP